jgi:hypothetical protein
MNERIDQKVEEPDAARSTVFRKRRFVSPQAPDQARRQAELVQSAWRHFREAAPMIAFLNTHHRELEAQPLSLAIESDDGLARVEQLLQQLPRNA